MIVRMSICLWILLMVGCDEQFPSYEEPKNVLDASLVRVSGDTVTITVDSLENFLSSEPTRLRLYVQNRYIQLLEGTALIQGRVNLFAFDPAPKVGTIEISRNNLFAPPIFRDNIALAPGDSARLDITWNHSVLSGRLYDSLHFIEFYNGRTRVRRYAPIMITAEAGVQLFERVQAVRTQPVSFSLVVQELKIQTQ
ncbi:MAG: hypothetical protein HY961_04100 [Ignavibacteriae bacterium]|nr:hypothetical protein [Ignavibacteriota bacterium]